MIDLLKKIRLVPIALAFILVEFRIFGFDLAADAIGFLMLLHTASALSPLAPPFLPLKKGAVIMTAVSLINLYGWLPHSLPLKIAVVAVCAVYSLFAAITTVHAFNGIIYLNDICGSTEFAPQLSFQKKLLFFAFGIKILRRVFLTFYPMTWMEYILVVMAVMYIASFFITVKDVDSILYLKANRLKEEQGNKK